MGYYPRGANIKTLAKSVERLLKRWASRIGCKGDVDRACQDISLCSSIEAEEASRIGKPKKQVGVSEEASSIDPPVKGGRLGRTERLVLVVLLANPLTPMTPAMIRAEIRERFSVELSSKAVYSALRRLMKRGWAERKGDKYILGSRFKSSDLYVENLRVGNKQVWSKRERGQPIPLSEALSLVESMGLAGEVANEGELSSYPDLTPETRREFAEVKRDGIYMTCVYYNQAEGPKIENKISYPPFTASPENYFNFIELDIRGKMNAISVILEDLKGRIDAGLKVNVTTWACRMRAVLDSFIARPGAGYGSRT